MKKRFLASLTSFFLLAGLFFPISAYAGNASDYLSQRIYGNTRYETSLQAANVKKSSGLSNIIVASGTDFPDALSGSYLAKKKNAPILLINKTNEATIKSFIDANLPSDGTVYLLGGAGCVSTSFEKSIGSRAKRLAGATRIETNLLILKEAGYSSSNDLLIVSGFGFADALSAAAVGEPILLVGNSLTSEQNALIKDMNPSAVYAIGGTAVVNNKIASATNASRLYGSTRYDTSAAIANKFFPSSTSAVLAYGEEFPDGLSGSSVAFMYNSPILLVSARNTTAAQQYCKNAGVGDVVALGGPSLISDNTVCNVFGTGTAPVETPSGGASLNNNMETIRCINAERSKYGLHELVYDPNLQAGVDVRAKEISTQFSHLRPNGSRSFTAYDYYSFSGIPSEDIAYAKHGSPQKIVDLWLSSTSGHREDILSDDGQYIAIGVAQNSTGYYCAAIIIHQ